jgi:hypothetical protein
MAVGVTPEGSETNAGVSLKPPLTPLPNSPVELSPQAKSATVDPAAAAGAAVSISNTAVVPNNIRVAAIKTFDKEVNKRITMVNPQERTGRASVSVTTGVAGANSSSLCPRVLLCLQVSSGPTAVTVLLSSRTKHSSTRWALY